MAKISSAPIINQPTTHTIYNTFNLMGNEKILRECIEHKGFCGCRDAYHTTLTDARLIIRTESKTCCCQPSYTDVSIFLRDIAKIRQSTESRENCSCCICCIRCCRVPKIIELQGVFGKKILRIPNDDMDYLQFEIPARVGNHKLISHH